MRAEEETAEDKVEEKVEDSSEEDTEPEKTEKTEEITEEKDVLVLHSVNFDKALSENKYLLVEFCKYSMTFFKIYSMTIIVLTNGHSDLCLNNARKHCTTI